MFVLTYLKLADTEKQNQNKTTTTKNSKRTNKQSKKNKKQKKTQTNKKTKKTQTNIIDCFILILYILFYTNLSLVLNNLQKIKQDLNAIFQWVAHLYLMPVMQLFVMIMEA
jgi:cation transport ATPase